MSGVSVIIPAYNRAGFLGEAIESVLGQSFPPLEILVIDDGSTDETARVCEEFGARIRYRHQENQGVSRARNRGIREATGEWLGFLDSDDLWCETKLEEQLVYASAHPDIRVLQCEEIWHRRGKRVNPRVIHQKHSGWIFEHCIPRCIISPSAILIHREVFERVGLFDETFPLCEDYDLWLRIALRYPVPLLDRPLIIKRNGHEGQLSAKFGQDVYRVKALQKILLDPDLNPEQKTLVQSDILRRARILAGGFEKRGNRSEAQYYRSMYQ